jgi:hypothetical protein
LLLSFHFHSSFAQVIFADDVIAIKNCSRPVAADLHCHTLRYSGPNHVADGGSTQVVEESLRRTRCGTNLLPRTAKISDWLSALTSEHQVAWLLAGCALREQLMDGVRRLMLNVNGSS